MEIIVSNNIQIRNPTNEIKNWVKKELIVPNPEYSTKVRMGLWTGKTPKDLHLYEENENTLILPYGCLKAILPMAIEADVSYEFKENKDQRYSEVALYDYQVRAVDEAINNVYGIIQAPPGSGKTQMGISIISKLKKKALWITHTQDLLTQSKERAEHYFGTKRTGIGTITAGKVKIGARITFATVQTLANLDLSKYKDEWEVIIVDECHRIAGSPTQLTQFYKVLNSLSAKHKYGLSATVHRADGMIKATFAAIGGICSTVTKEEVGDKIMKVGIKEARTGITLRDEALNSDGTLNYQKLISYLTNNGFRNGVIATAINQNYDYSSLILSDRVSHLEELMKLVNSKFSVMIDGKTKKEDREQALDDIRTGKKRFLFATYKLAKEGLDLPILSRLYLTTPQKDYAIVSQSIGRIARMYPNKPKPIAYDFVDSIRYLERSYKKRWTTYNKMDCYKVD